MALREDMRLRYAVHYSKLGENTPAAGRTSAESDMPPEESEESDASWSKEEPPGKGSQGDMDTDAGDSW